VATLRFHVVPNAKSDEVVGEYGNAIKIKLRALPVEGKANMALLRFLAERLELPRRAIVLERGRTAREKVLCIAGLTDEEARRRLLAGA
jgi:uncharacterized protein (TIGR00251 family)